ncbi:hypothetical protein [uncultured Gammaproteobacteria bacterium]|jgi:hypothetical protein|nr:hypothetical protein [uncultured Gammaproteobacteria bacterium]CAC9956632.1 hypothetical protein [uncultured Gammaproteobacteria bacterium]
MKFIIVTIIVLSQSLIFAQCLNTYSSDGGINLPDGSIYHGKVENNLFNDTAGFLNWTNGTAYVGGFKDGLMNGIGKIKFANGIKYKGQFKSGLVHGYGIMNFTNGDKYEGYFKNDLFDGPGKLKYNNSDFYHGEFKQDNFHGNGFLSFSSGDIVTFGGIFFEGKAQNGTLTFVNGDVYKGEVNNELYPHGKGEYIFKDKEKKSQKGIFKYGKFNEDNNNHIENKGISVN